MILITYLIASRGNPLYDGRYMQGNTAKTFGHQSFLYDFINTCQQSMSISLRILTDDLDAFPFPFLIEESKVECIEEFTSSTCYLSDIFILDTLSGEQLLNLNLIGFKIGIIHNYLQKQPEIFYSFCDKIVCLTEKAMQKQKAYADPEKLVTIYQGIDLARFKPPVSYPVEIKKDKNALIYSRMDEHKGKIYLDIIKKLIAFNWQITILGDGIYFWQAANTYNERITPITYIPCYSIHSFLLGFDLVVSNGRGVLEAMACNIPTIGAGLRYCGLINKSNIEDYYAHNFTGAYLMTSPDILEDYNENVIFQKANNRVLAEQYFDNRRFVNSLIDLWRYP